MTQYADYGSIPQAVRDLVANKISLLDSYILMQTGQYEYTALVNKPGLGCKEIRIYRSGNYNSEYAVEITDGSWEYSVNNEYYCYSNVGYGSALSLPATESVGAFSCCIMACALMLAIVFKGALYKWLK